MPPTDVARGSVLVIGGGVVGLMSAYALARSGWIKKTPRFSGEGPHGLWKTRFILRRT